jgi:uncharacterized membrane protein
MNLPWHVYLMAVVYILAGINHFRIPGIYQKIIPSYFPNPKVLNNICGFTEIFFGILLCIPSCTLYAAWGIIILLIAVFPTHIYMYQNEKASMNMPKWILLLRMPFHLVLLYWAYEYTFLKI